jgi:hypothetical protein
VKHGTVPSTGKDQPDANGSGPARGTDGEPAAASSGTAASNSAAANSAAPDGVTAISALGAARKAAVEGKVRSVEIRPVANSCVFECTVADGTGSLTVMFYGRTHIPGLEPGARIRLAGKVSMRAGGPAMINPAYELLARDG